MKRDLFLATALAILTFAISGVALTSSAQAGHTTGYNTTNGTCFADNVYGRNWCRSAYQPWATMPVFLYNNLNNAHLSERADWARWYWELANGPQKGALYWYDTSGATWIYLNIYDTGISYAYN